MVEQSGRTWVTKFLQSVLDAPDVVVEDRWCHVVFVMNPHVERFSELYERWIVARSRADGNPHGVPFHMEYKILRTHCRSESLGRYFEALVDPSSNLGFGIMVNVEPFRFSSLYFSREEKGLLMGCHALKQLIADNPSTQPVLTTLYKNIGVHLSHPQHAPWSIICIERLDLSRGSIPAEELIPSLLQLDIENLMRNLKILYREVVDIRVGLPDGIRATIRVELDGTLSMKFLSPPSSSDDAKDQLLGYTCDAGSALGRSRKREGTLNKHNEP